MVDGVLVTALRRVRRGTPAPYGTDVSEPGAATRLRPIQLRRVARLLPGREGGAPPTHSGRAGDDELRAVLRAAGQVARPVRVGAASRRGQLRLVPGPARPGRRRMGGARLR